MHRGDRGTRARDFAGRDRTRVPQWRAAWLRRRRCWCHRARDRPRYVDPPADRGPDSPGGGARCAGRRCLESPLGTPKHPAAAVATDRPDPASGGVRTACRPRNERRAAGSAWHRVEVRQAMEQGRGAQGRRYRHRRSRRSRHAESDRHAGAGVGRHRRCAGGIDRRLAGPETAALRGRGGVHLHGVAGLDLEASLGLAGVLASDLLPEIPRVMERLR